MKLRFLLPACLVLLCGLSSCGKEGPEPVGSVDSESGQAGAGAIEPSTDWFEVGATPADDLIVIAVDGLRFGNWAPTRLPNLATLATEGRSFHNHVVSSTGSHAQMASLLTGQPPLEHGIGSVHERGRTFLSPDAPNLATHLTKRGFQTLASVAVPQFGPQVGGMDQGFSVFVAPSVLGESARSSERVDMVVQAEWAQALANEQSMFALWQLSDFQNPDQAPSENVRLHVQAALRSMAGQYPTLAQLAEEVVKGPEEFEGVRRSIMRQRGTALHQAYVEAVYAGQLMDLDAFVGRLVSDLGKAGRLERSLIALVSMRGSLLGSPPAGAPAFLPDVIRCPLVMWSPKRIRPGTDTALISTSQIASRLCFVLGEDFGGERKQASALQIVDAGLARRASATADLHIEENAAAGRLAFDRGGAAMLRKESLSAELQEQWETAESDFEGSETTFGYRLDFDLPPSTEVKLTWRMVEGRYRRAVASVEGTVDLARGTPLMGRATLRGKGSLKIETFLREQALVLAWKGAPGPSRTTDAPRFWLLGESPEETEEAQSFPWAMQFLREGGIWTRALVQGEKDRSLEAFVALVSSQQTSGRKEAEIEWTSDFEDEVEWVQGRQDGLRLLAKTPLNAQFKEPPGYDLAAAFSIDGRWLLPSEVALHESPLFQEGSASLYVPDWWPGMTESLSDLTGWELFEGMHLVRLEAGRIYHQAVPDGAKEFVRRMGRAE